MSVWKQSSGRQGKSNTVLEMLGFILILKKIIGWERNTTTVILGLMLKKNTLEFAGVVS